MTRPTPLADTLRQPALAGLHPLGADDAAALARSAHELGFAFVRIELAGCADKAQLLARTAEALHFPDWFGHNLDALADCLVDLAWLPAPGYVLILENPAALAPRAAAEFDAVLAVFADAAREWATAGVPMWIFIGPPGEAPSPRLP